MLKKIFKIYKRHNKFIPLLVLGGVFSAFTSVFMNYSLKNAVDAIFNYGKHNAGYAIAVFVIMSVLVFVSDQIVEGYYVSKWNLNISKDVRNKLFESYFGSSYKDALQQDLGHLTNVDDMVSEVSETYTSLFFSLPYAVFETIGFLVFLFIFIDWKMTIIVFLLVPMVFLTKSISEKIRNTNEKINKEKTELNNFFFEAINKLDFIKANNFNAAVAERYNKKNKMIVTAQKILYRNNIIYLMVQFLMQHGIKLIVPIYGMYLCTKGDITPGGIAVCSTIFSSFLVPSTFQLLDMYKEIKAMAPSVDEVYNVLYLPQPMQTRDVIKITTLPKDILLKADNISFAYNENLDVIKNLTLELPATGSVGICGLSGEGKSTLAKLIANLYTPYEGNIVYNAQYFPHDENIRDSIAFTANEMGFTQDTIYNNIFCGGPAVYDTVKAVGMHDFIDSMPNGYETELSEGDTNLSGGQKQLLRLARALSKDSSLLILDEPTSSVDQETEKHIIELINKISTKKCVLVISHKPETLMCTDTIYVCNQGHLELINKTNDLSELMSNILAERGKYV